MKYIYLTAILVLFSVFSCEEFLEEEVYSNQISENFYTNIAEAEGALLGIINQYSDNTNYQLLNMEEYRTDNVLFDAACILRTDHNIQFSRKDVKSTNAIVESVYTSLYSNVYNCNGFIHFMEKTTWSEREEDQKPQYIAEAYTLRAIAYFKLVRLFGEVPLVVDYNDNTPTGPLAIGRTSVREIYNQIISDLETAKSLYLQEGKRSPVFPSKILARMVLAKVYLTMSGKPLDLGTDYLELAHAESDTLIHSKAEGIAVPELVNFEELFSSANENRGEILLSAQNYGAATGQIWATGDFSYGALSYDLIREFDTSGPIDLTNPNRDIRNVNPNNTAYDISLYSNESDFIDGRFYPTFWPFRGQWNSTTGNLPNFNDPLNYLSTPSLYTTANINKTVFPGKLRMDYEFRSEGTPAYPHYDKKANVVLYRWAEAFLIFAETDNELNGPQAEAIEAVNKIRNRAGLEDLPALQTATKEDFRNEIRKEWRLEFVTEGKHFYNLQRWGTLIEKVNAFVIEYNAFNPEAVMFLLEAGKDEIYPIPFDEIDRTGFIQNPGY